MRKYNPGDKVKWIKTETPGQPKTREWVDGYVEMAGKDSQGDVIFVRRTKNSETSFPLPAYAVKPIINFIDDETVRQYGVNNIDKLFELVQSAVNELLPACKNHVEKDNKEPILLLMNGNVTIEPTIIEVEGLDDFTEVCGWSVTIWTYHSGSYHEPPSTDDCHVGNCRNEAQAAKLAVETMFGILSESYWEKESCKCWGEEDS